jgi:hypothetical protein
MGVSENLKTLIIRTAVKEVSYNPETGKLLINQRELNSEESAILRAKVVEEGHSPYDFSRIIQDTLDSSSTSTPKVKIEYTVQPDEFPPGQHLVLIGKSPDYGIARLELMCIASNRFLVLDTGRRVLQREDILESVTMPWNANYKVNFNVLRNGMPFPDDSHLYQTYRLECIELHNPPVIYEYLDKPEERKEPEWKIEIIDKKDSKTVETPRPDPLQNEQSTEEVIKQEISGPGSQTGYLTIYTADKLTHIHGFKHIDLIRRKNYKGGIFEICLLSINEARLRINDRQMVQDKIFGSLNLLDKACERRYKAIGEPRHIFTIKEGALKKENDIWIIVEKMKIELR